MLFVRDQEPIPVKMVTYTHIPLQNLGIHHMSPFKSITNDCHSIIDMLIYKFCNGNLEKSEIRLYRSFNGTNFLFTHTSYCIALLKFLNF